MLCTLGLCAACSDAQRTAAESEDAQDGGSRSPDASLGASNDAAAGHEPLKIIADGQDAPSALAIDDRYVYWTTRSALRRAPLAGGTAETLATSAGLGMIAVARGAVFFTDGSAGTVSMVDREGGPVTVIGGGAAPHGIALHDDTVYWANRGTTLGEGTIAKVSPDGMPATILATGLVLPTGLAVDSGWVYFSSGAQGCVASPSGGGCTGGGVHKVPIGGGRPIQLDSQDTPLAIALSARGAYWMLNTPPQVMFAPADGTQTRTLADAPGEESGPIAVDEEAFYWSSASRGRVLKVSLDGGEPQAVVTDLGVLGGIAVDRDWIYVAATSQGRILRVDKGGWANVPAGPITGPCPTPLGTAAEIAATPRADANLELLALQLDASSVTATQETYDRVLADVAAIRAAEPALADIGYFPRHDGKQLLLSPNTRTLQSINAGEYSAWDCLNDFYGLQSLELGSSFVVLKLKGSYALGPLAELYAKLPGIEAVSSNAGGGDGPTICARRADAKIEYVIDRAGGDCPAGCNIHDTHYFPSTAPGVVEAGGTWHSEAGVPPPEWFARVCGR